MNKPFVVCLWFDREAEQAAKFYTSVFKDGKIGDVTYYSKEGFEIHGMPEGTAMTVSFTVNGQEFMGLNGGPIFKFTEAVSFIISCKDQEEVDYYWNKLTEGGEEAPCGWLKDKFGLSWQVVPVQLQEMLKDPAKAPKVTQAFLQMKKFDIEKLKEAYHS